MVLIGNYMHCFFCWIYTGDSKYTHRAENDESDKELIHRHNMSHDDMWDHMVDIDGKLNGEDAFDSYIDEEAWEVDSDVYSIRSISSTDDLAEFINDCSDDYETDNDTDSGEDF